MLNRSRSLLIRIAFVVAAAGLCGKAGAAEQLPTWLTTPPSADATYYYYVGSANEAPSLDEAKEAAYKNAVAEVIRDRFGVVTQIENDQYLTDSDSHAITRVRESSQSVKIRGLEKVDSFIEKRKDKFYAAILFRYAKSEATLEKVRLANSSVAQNEAPKQIEGTAYATDLVLTTEPQGATVWINDLPLGKTPLNIKGLLPPGPMHVRFDQPFFEVESKDLVLISGETAEVHALLRPSKASLIVEDVPPHSDILIDGQAQAASWNKFELIAGKPYRIEIRNADFHPMVIEELILDRDEVRKIAANLIPKPSRLKIASIPSGAFIRIEGINSGRAPLSKTSAPGRYQIEVVAAGFSPEVFEVNLAANQKVEKVVKLSKAERRKPSSELQTNEVASPSNSIDSSNPSVFSIGAEIAGPQFTSIAADMARMSFEAKTVGKNFLGYGATLSFGVGEGRAGHYDASITEQFGSRFNLNHEFNIFGLGVELGGELGYHTGDISLKTPAGADVTHKSWYQTSVGEYLGVNFNSHGGSYMQAQFGARKYGDCEALRGANAVFLNFSWGGAL